MNYKKYFLLFIGLSFSCRAFEAEKEKQLYALDTVTSEDIIFRFYCLQRLEPAIDCLTQVTHDCDIPCPLTYSFESHKVYMGNKTFFSKSMISILHEMHDKNSLKPFFTMWKKLKQYKYLNHSNIIEEFSNLLAHLLTSSVKKSFPQDYTVNKTMILFDSVQGMDLKEILNILDVLIEEIPLLLGKYELHSEMTWASWTKKYLIPATLSLSLIGIKLYMIFQQKNTDLIIKNQKEIITMLEGKSVGLKE